jgi:hypothetical protein
MSVVFLQPDSSVVLGLDRAYLFAGLLIVLTTALAHYSKLVLVTAVLIAAIGANLPQEIARALNVDARYFMIGLVIVLLVAVQSSVSLMLLPYPYCWCYQSIKSGGSMMT